MIQGLFCWFVLLFFCHFFFFNLLAYQSGKNLNVVTLIEVNQLNQQLSGEVGYCCVVFQIAQIFTILIQNVAIPCQIFSKIFSLFPKKQ